MRTLVIGLAIVTCTACGGSGGGSTTPAPVVAAPTITTTNTMVYVGQTVAFAATGSGTIRWGGDNSQVATIDQTTGRVTGVGNGRVTIWAENEGGRTTRLLRGLPSYAGTWTGNWVVEGCVQNGAFGVLNVCSGHPGGLSRSLAFSASQSDDRVSGGTLGFGGITGPISPGTVAEDGQLRLTATMTPLSGNSIRISVENVVLHSPASGNVQGTLEQVWSDTTLSGTMRVYARVGNLTRTSGAPLALQGTAGEARTYADLLRLMR